MTRIDRRTFTHGLGAGGAVALGLVPALPALGQARGRVVVIGGGIGGATVATYLKKASPGLDVTLVEPNLQIMTCAGSNLYIGGVRTAEDLTHDYRGLKRRAIKIVSEMATAIDTTKRTVTLSGGSTLAYDRLVVSPGIDVVGSEIEGYGAAGDATPHAWSGGRQTLLLKRQLEDMEDGGVVVMTVPAGTYRCPPAPYERACMIATYLKRTKPRSKVILLDAKKTFVKEDLFKAAFAGQYPGMIELVQSTDIDDFSVVRVDGRERSVTTKAGRTFKGAVVNLIPPQRAGAIAARAGLTNGDWCPVDPSTFASRKVKDVYVIGDAAQADPMPKSGFATNSQAKLVAAAITADLSGGPRYPARLRNTCWSLLSRANAVKIAASYAVKDGRIAVVNTFTSQANEPVLVRARTAAEYFAWYTNMTADSFGKTLD